MCLFIMHSHPAGTSATKLCMAASFIQRKIEGYIWIKIEKKLKNEGHIIALQASIGSCAYTLPAYFTRKRLSIM